MRRTLSQGIGTVWLILAATVTLAEHPWIRHTIDDSSRGADGVRIADINRDGFPDLTTGWEEGGVIRVYINPGPERIKLSWPAVTVGRVNSPEDAVFVDLDADGNVDVVSSCEGNTNSVFVHWAPDASRMLDEQAWTTEPIPALEQLTRWMFCLPMQVDGRHGIDLILGSKEPGAVVGWLQAPESPRVLTDWKWHPLYRAGWIMSLEEADVNGDGLGDLLVTDRKGANRGLYLFERTSQSPFWTTRKLGGSDHEVMFLDRDPSHRAPWEIVVSTRDQGILGFSRTDSPTSLEFQQSAALPPAANTGTLKSVRWCDVDLDGTLDLVYSCENATGSKSGIVWLKAPAKNSPANWTRHEISGPEGVKFDLIQLLDLDRDGDLDIVTCEERDNLGVIWYENPRK